MNGTSSSNGHTPTDDFRRVLRGSVTPVTWQTWLQPLHTAVSAGVLSLGAPNEFHRRWVAERHLDTITVAAHTVFGDSIGVVLDVDGHMAPQPADEGPSHDYDVVITADSAVPIPVQDLESRLIAKYTFENFVVGQSNRFAHAAAMAVGEQAGTHYNPLFIYGQAGLGKTHLLHAVGHHRRELVPGSVVRYVSSEQFFNEFINGIRRKQMAEFKARYRTIDVLLLDDVQFFEGKDQILEEFFHTFNSLYEAGKQLVISSDRPPKSLASLEDRLRSRFQSGLTTDVHPPDMETRLAILRKNAEFAPLTVPEDVLEFIGYNVLNNIRELEGALTRVTAYAALTHERITLEMAEDVLQDILPGNRAHVITAALVKDRVAAIYNLTIEDLDGPSRKQPLARSRQIAMYLCRELTDMSLPRIGAAFGGRDHTTVIHAVERVKQLMANDKATFDEVTSLCQQLKAS